MVDQNASHQMRSDREELRAILPARVLLIGEPEISLMHKRRGLQSVIGTFLSQPLPRKASQFLVDERNQALGGVGLASVPLAENLGDFSGRRFAHNIVSANHRTGKRAGVHGKNKVTPAQFGDRFSRYQVSQHH
jgi:hypothetical protein